MADQATPSRSGLGSRSRSPRKYTIRSQFGHARQRGSRKSRPCDACRRRKTACVISTVPPCLFCRSRGLVCESVGVQASIPDSAGAHGSRRSSETSGEQLDSPGPEDRSLILGSRFPPLAGLAAFPAAIDDHFETTNPELASPVSSRIAPARSSVDTPSSGSSLRINQITSSDVRSLEDIGNRTSHSIGLAAEQDSYLLDAFRSVLYSEKDEIDANIIQVNGGNVLAEKPPVHFLLLENEFPDHTNRAMQAASDAIETIVHPSGPSLVRLYFSFIHPSYPVLSKGRFLGQYFTDRYGLPASLRGAVYALACAFWRKDASLILPCPFQQHELVDHAHASLRRELEAPTLYKLQACLLLLHPRAPDIDSVETPYTWMLAAQATACAQMIGLHRNPTDWQIAPWEKHLRRKLWWATYMTDCWSSVCHGNPPHIDANSFDTNMLCIDDIRSDEDVSHDLSHHLDSSRVKFRIEDGVRFLEMIKISHHLRGILDCSFQVNNERYTGKTSSSSCDELVALKQKNEEWRALIPYCLGAELCGPHEIHWNAPLHLAFYATQVLCFRALMSPATREAKRDPNSNLRRWFKSALKEFRLFIEFVDCLTNADLGSFWVRHARTQLILCGNFLIYLFLLASEPDDVQAAFLLLERFHQTLQKLGTTEDVDGKLLLRPVILRIDSFFAQATHLLKKGSNVNTDPATIGST